MKRILPALIKFVVLGVCLTFGELLNLFAEQALSGVIAEIKQKYSSVDHISIQQFQDWKAQQKKLVLLDVRSSDEYRVSHLQGAQHVDPDHVDVEKLVASLPKDARVLLYCSVGHRSSKLALELKENGVERVYNLEGGIFKAVAEHVPVYSDSGQVDKVHPYNSSWGNLLSEEFYP